MKRKSILLLSLLILPPLSYASVKAPLISIEYGAKVFYDRCSLCHGNDGLGEGILSLSIKNYPNTNLTKVKNATNLTGIRNAIVYGGSQGDLHEEMPPWGDELTYRDLESVSRFVDQLRKDPGIGRLMLKNESNYGYATTRTGRGVFITRCALCHGKFGEGDGRMSRVIKNPSPFNLTLSTAPDDYLEQIIAKGGIAVGRSSRMPPWGGDLTDLEIESVILYLKTIRVVNK